MMELSDDAMQMLTGCFLSQSTSLTMHNEQSRLTDRALSGINELVTAGLLTATPFGKTGMKYEQTAAGKAFKRQSFKWMMKQSPIKAAEKISGVFP